MDTSNIRQSVSKYVSLEPEEVLFFTSLFIPIQVRQGGFLDEAGEISKGFLYVDSGCLMTFITNKQGNDQVVQFSTSGWWTGDLNSFTRQTPATYSTKALADSEVFLLPKNSLDQLLGSIPKFEKYFRIIFQNSLITHQHRLVMAFSATAEERYQEFEEKYPVLEQFVPLKYIASYLGITPEFLSKIRRRRMEK